MDLIAIGAAAANGGSGGGYDDTSIKADIQANTKAIQKNETDILSVEDKIKKLEDNYVTPEMYGAIGDGVTDDTMAIQTAVEKAYELSAPLKLISMYCCDSISVENTITIYSDDISNGLKKIPKNETHYRLLEIKAENCEIYGFTLVGDRDDNSAIAEWGHCLAIRNANCYIHDMRIVKAHGDGISVGGNNASCDNTVIERCFINEAYRNGVAFIDAVNFKLLNCIIENTNGADPQYAVDCEPDYEGEQVTGIIDGLITRNNLGGISCFINDEQTKPMDIIVRNYTSIGETSRHPIFVREQKYVDGSRFIFDEVNIVDFNTRTDGTPINFTFDSTDNAEVMCNAKLINCKGSNAVLVKDTENKTSSTNQLTFDVKTFASTFNDVFYFANLSSVLWKATVETNGTIGTNKGYPKECGVTARKMRYFSNIGSCLCQPSKGTYNAYGNIPPVQVSITSDNRVLVKSEKCTIRAGCVTTLDASIIAEVAYDSTNKGLLITQTKNGANTTANFTLMFTYEM